MGMIERTPGVEAMLLDTSGRVAVSSGWPVPPP